jgi:hypothetical protein
MGDNHVHFVLNKLARKFGKLSQLTFGVPFFKSYVSAFSPSKLLQVLAKVGHAGSRLASFRAGGWRFSEAAGQNPYPLLFLPLDNISADENDNYE